MVARKFVYIVDDDLGFLNGLERLLSALGMLVRTFASADEFKALAIPGEASCLILDIHLGSVSGIDLMRELFNSGATTPVVLITANDNETTRKAAFSSGCSAFLCKPVSAAVLVSAVRTATAGR